jgi:hypothetical protein
MQQVQITGWLPGFGKVAFTKLQQEYLGLSLSDAHQNTNHLLNGQVLVFGFEDHEAALQFKSQVTDIKGIFKFSD